MEDIKRFKELDESFQCQNCGKIVDKLNYSSRDHCNYCLHSLHVDISPGDRKCECCGLLQPIDIEKFKDTYKIIYICKKCGYRHKNIMARDDDMDAIIELTRREK